MRAAPWNICAAIWMATSRRSPIITPPSASDSRMTYAKAGPLELRAVTASICLSSSSRQRPTARKISIATSAWASETPASRAMTVIARDAGVSDAHAEVAMEIFRAVGRCLELEDKQMDAVTALNSSGPASPTSSSRRSRTAE